MPSNFFSISLLSVSILVFHFVPVESSLAPALYIFGDSLSDSGNNNYLKTLAKSNYKPYGIDFPERIPTGRFTNGLTFVDFIAKWLGLPFAPAYLSLSDDKKSKITTGVNYASGAAGILPETGTAIGDVLTLDEQIMYFQSTVQNDLPKSIKTQEELSQYLSKSIFSVMIGSNDYINNYLQPATYDTSKKYNPMQFGKLLSFRLANALNTLHNLGARKFMLFELGPIGCIPATVNSINPKPNTTCIEPVNDMLKIFNSELPRMIQKLSSTLHGSTFVKGDVYKHSHETNQNPIEFGFADGVAPCCVVGGHGTTPCIPNQIPCKYRNRHLYWDSFHPTEEMNFRIAKGCFNGSVFCAPINIEQLAQV